MKKIKAKIILNILCIIFSYICLFAGSEMGLLDDALRSLFCGTALKTILEIAWYLESINDKMK